MNPCDARDSCRLSVERNACRYHVRFHERPRPPAPRFRTFPAHAARGAGWRVQPRLRPPAGALARAVQAPRREEACRAGRGYRGLRGEAPQAHGGQARDSARRIAAHHRARRRDRQADPRAPGGGDRRRNRLGQDHAVAQAVPGRRPRRSGADRLHPAAPAGRAFGGAPRGGGTRHPARRPGGLPGALHRPGERAHAGEVHDRRHPARRNAGRSLAVGLRHPDHRRGARAQPQHRLPARLSQAPRREAARPQDHRHLGHHRHRAFRGTLRRRAGGLGGRPRVSGGAALAARRPARRRTRARRGPGQHRTHRRRARRDRGRPQPGRRPRRRAGVPARRARDPRRAPAAVAPAIPRDRDPAAVRAALRRRPGPRVQARSETPRGAGDERGGNLAHRAAHPLRGRHRPGAREALQPAQPARTPARGAGLAGRRRPAQGPLRPHRPRHLLPPVRRGGFRRAQRIHRPRTAALLAGQRDPAHAGAAAGRGGRFPLPRRARSARGGRRLPPPRRDRRDRRGAHAHRDRPHAGPAADRRAAGAHAGGSGKARRAARAADGGVLPQHPGPARTPR